MSSYKKTLDYLFKLAVPVIRPGLSRTRRLLKLIGNPQKSYPTVLIGGTNGKGSTLAILEAVLKESGFRVGVYTSPHIERFNERIKVGGREITSNKIVSIAKSLRSIIKREDKGSLKNGASFFEFTTVMALEYFREKNVDIALLEVGMGGRFDSTNVVVPELSIITNVGLDHFEFLGATLAQVAVEKAGIVKNKGRVVVGRVRPAALKVIKAAVNEQGADGFFMDKDFSVKRSKSGKFNYKGEEELKDLSLVLKGEHQLENAACALKAIEILRARGFSIPIKAVRQGLKRVSWPGRLEVLSAAPDVILDVAHNVGGAEALSAYLKGVKKERIVVVLGIMEDKDIRGMLREFTSIADVIVLTAPDAERSATVERLAKELDGLAYRGKIVLKQRVSLAVKTAVKEAGRGGAVCVSGSIYTVAEARRYLKRRH